MISTGHTSMYLCYSWEYSIYINEKFDLQNGSYSIFYSNCYNQCTIKKQKIDKNIALIKVYVQKNSTQNYFSDTQILIWIANKTCEDNKK